MPRSTMVLAAMLAVAPAAARAQTPEHTNLVLTIQGGIIGGADLRHIPRQILPSALSGFKDTVQLGRRLTSGVAALVSATYFKSPNLGYYAEVGYFGISSEGACAGVGAFTADSSPNAEVPPPNQKACEAINGGTVPTSMVALQAGLVYRLVPNAGVSPYARATVGVGALSNSFIEESAYITSASACQAFGTTQCLYTLLRDPREPSYTWVGTLAIGNVIQISPAYNARIEVRDLITSLPIATDSGTVSGQPTAKTGWRTRHMFGLTIGLDIVLERSHRRRY